MRLVSWTWTRGPARSSGNNYSVPQAAKDCQEAGRHASQCLAANDLMGRQHQGLRLLDQRQVTVNRESGADTADPEPREERGATNSPAKSG